MVTDGPVTSASDPKPTPRDAPLACWNSAAKQTPKYSARAGPLVTQWAHNGDYRSIYSALMPAVLITLAHFSVSSEISFPKSAGEPDRLLTPSSASRALIL